MYNVIETRVGNVLILNELVEKVLMNKEVA
jgi:hypothetical protein